jgi:hypothetical protein
VIICWNSLSIVRWTWKLEEFPYQWKKPASTRAVLLQCANGNRGFIELFGPAEAEI